MDISNAIESLRNDFSSVDSFVNELYDKYFQTYFAEEERLYARFKSASTPVTDDELEWIITSLPLDLYGASNALAQFKSHYEIVKLNLKQSKQSRAEAPSDATDVQEYQVMSIVYEAVINRVERQIAFSKELIMGAKKVWDARRKTEQTPIKEVTPTLPDYNGVASTYIKGQLERGGII